MEAQAVRPTHPLLIIAAIAVTLFSLVGIGAMLGWIPISTGGQSGATPPAPVAPAPAQPEASAPVAERAMPAPKPVKKAASKHDRAPTPPAQMAEAMNPPPPPPSAAPVIICNECGVIESVGEIKKEGQGSGVGAVGGAVVGGVVGHQLGNGRGRDVMTVLGALGGAVAGNKIEKNAKTSSEYRITVRFNDGTTRLYPSATPPTWHIGDKVKVINGVIQADS
ncbi:MAG: glycine zipper 2TM domain-containing protein [Burkholderiales bacterium]